MDGLIQEGNVPLRAAASSLAERAAARRGQAREFHRIKNQGEAHYINSENALAYPEGLQGHDSLMLQLIALCWQHEGAFKWMLIRATPISRLLRAPGDVVIGAS